MNDVKIHLQDQITLFYRISGLCDNGKSPTAQRDRVKTRMHEDVPAVRGLECDGVTCLRNACNNAVARCVDVAVLRYDANALT